MLKVAQPNRSRVGCNPRASLPKDLKLWLPPSRASLMLAEEEEQKRKGEEVAEVMETLLGVYNTPYTLISSDIFLIEVWAHSILPIQQMGKSRPVGNSNLPKYS